jgi:FXSXX-COOH protein
MNSAADLPADGVDCGGALADVADIPLEALFTGSSALAGALRRSAQEARSPEDLYAAFGSVAPAPGEPSA